MNLNASDCRHCGIRCDNESGCCIRQAALKFADQNEDGPFDLILHTGQTSLARNCNTYVKALRATTPGSIKKLCMEDPY